MATYTFTDAQFLSLSLDKNYRGADDYYLNLNKKITIEGFLYSSDATLGVGKNYAKISSMLQEESGDYSEIIINNKNFGKGKVLGISFPKENPVRLGAYIYDIEIKENSDFSNLPTGLYGKNLTGLKEQILEFSEKLSCSYSQDKKTFDHSLSLQLNYTGQDLINASKIIASGIFNDDSNLPLVREFSGIYNSLKKSKSTFREDYDLVTSKVNFNKNIEIYNSGGLDLYTVNLNHSLSKDDKGMISVVEEGDVFLLNDNRYSFASGVINTLNSQSYNRCNNFFVKNSSFSSVVLNDANNLILDPLYNIPMEFGSTYNLSGYNVKYRTVYTNDPNAFGNYALEYSNTENLNNIGLKDISENGSIVFLGNNTLSDYPKNIISQRTGLFQKIKNFTENFSLLHSDGIYQNKFSYSFAASPNDNNILINDPDFNYISVDISKTNAQYIINEYVIPNHISNYVLPNLSSSSTLAQINVTINAVLKSSANPSGQSIAARLLNTGLTSIVGEGSYVLGACSYTYNSNNQATLTLTSYG